MNELKLTLESVNPVQFWGTNNEHYELIKNAFPKLKVVARGNEVKVLGDDQELKAFEQKYNQLLSHLEQYSNLTPGDVETILVSRKSASTPENTTEKPAATGGGGEVIVFGTNGLMVKARTANQRRMVDSIVKNDVLFAIGPAGTGKTYTAVALAVRALKNKEIK